MRILCTTLATIALMTAILLPSAAPVAAASPNCGIYPEFRGYRDNNMVGLLGFQCPQFTTIGYDDSFADSTPGFTGSDDNALDSWRFYNDTGSTWCLMLAEGYNGNGTVVFWTLASTPTSWTLSDVSTHHDRFSSVQFWKKTATSPCS